MTSARFQRIYFANASLEARTMPDFTERVVAVTGAAGRLGRRLTRSLAQHGAIVAAVDRPDALDDADRPDAARAHPFDAADEEAVRDGFAQIRSAHGRLDALVHTVGTWAGAPLLDTSQEEFERLLRLNLTSAFLCFREAARQMQRGGDDAGAPKENQGPAKRLVGIASGQGADFGAARQYGYSTSKAGVVRLVEAASRELKGTGITTSAVAPSTILFDEHPDREGVPAERLVALIEHVLSPAGDALNGAVLRAYGSAR
ncbi:MAG: NAD(P)-dependent oxidoreductase [Bacteroidetes bacterium QS_8_68_15]|nr:MAG: NAD(P)-dependent oxidoreductase [Bacteroidetes bacterium QS_8_68_15]